MPCALHPCRRVPFPDFVTHHGNPFPNPHYPWTLLLQSPIRCYDEPSASGLAPRTRTVLLGTGDLYFGACPRLSSGTGTAADVGAGPLRFTRRSRSAAQRFRDEPS